MSDALRTFKESAASTAQAVSENLNVNKCIYQRLLLWWKKTRPKLPAVSAPFTLFQKQKKSSGQRNSPNRETAVYLAGTIRTTIMYSNGLTGILSPGLCDPKVCGAAEKE